MGYIARMYESISSAVVHVNEDDHPVALEFGKTYIVDNDGANPADDYTLDLPAIVAADKGKKIWVKTRYSNDPGDSVNFGHAVLKSGNFSFRGTSAQAPDLVFNDDDHELSHDGVATWLFG